MPEKRHRHIRIRGAPFATLRLVSQYLDDFYIYFLIVFG